MLGFVDALAIVIFSAQISSLEGGSLLMLGFVVLAMAIVYLFPKLTDKVPSTLVALLAVTALSLLTGGTTTSVGAMAQISAGLPNFWVPTILADPQTWVIVMPYAVSLAFVGLLETMLTEQVVDEMTGKRQVLGRNHHADRNQRRNQLDRLARIAEAVNKNAARLLPVEG